MPSGDTAARGRGGEWGRETRHPKITRRWLEAASLAHQAAFEEEMARHRRSLDREFDRFWRSQRPD